MKHKIQFVTNGTTHEILFKAGVGTDAYKHMLAARELVRAMRRAPEVSDPKLMVEARGEWIDVEVS